MAKAVTSLFCIVALAGCVSQPRMFTDAELDAYAYSAGVVNSPFMRYMDQRDAERRLAREIADELERRSIQP